MLKTHLTKVSVLFFILLTALTLLPLALNGLPHASAQCTPPECYEPSQEPSYEPPSGSDQSWSGFSDGRLSPDMAEFYSVWCRDDLVQIWGGSPSPSLIDSVPVNRVVNMTAPFTTSIGMTFDRVGDLVTISGEGGHSPGFGSKSFSIDACILSNGGPGPSENPQPQLLHDQPPAVPQTSDEEEAARDFRFCLIGHEHDFPGMVECIDFFFLSEPQSAGFLFTIFSALWTMCLNGLVPAGLAAAIPAARFWRRRRM